MLCLNLRKRRKHLKFNKVSDKDFDLNSIQITICIRCTKETNFCKYHLFISRQFRFIRSCYESTLIVNIDDDVGLFTLNDSFQTMSFPLGAVPLVNQFHFLLILSPTQKDGWGSARESCSKTTEFISQVNSKFSHK